MKITVKLVYQYMVIFFTFSPTSNHLHPLQVENCGSNSQFVVDDDDYGKFRIERVKHRDLQILGLELNKIMSNFQPLEVVICCSETQFHMGQHYNS